MIPLAVLLLLCPPQEKFPTAPVRSGVLYLLDHQRPDGSWGAPPATCKCRGAAATPEGADLETTAWAVLGLIAAGYSEKFEKAVDGRKPGDSLRRALDWLVSRQDQDGAFDRANAEANAIAALAVIETYGLFLLRKGAAEKAYAWMEKASFSSVIGRIRLGTVIQSAKLSEIGTGHNDRLLELSRSLAKEEGEVARAAGKLMEVSVDSQVRRGFKADYDGIRPLDLSAEALNIFADASWRIEGGPRWHEWFKELRRVLEPLQRTQEGACERGSWDGDRGIDRIRTTAIRCITVEHSGRFCYYYDCQKATRKK